MIDRFKAHTAPKRLNVINVLVEKPFVARAKSKGGNLWRSGELFTAYHDWLLHRCEESIFDCNSGGVPHRHCMDTMIAESICDARRIWIAQRAASCSSCGRWPDIYSVFSRSQMLRLRRKIRQVSMPRKPITRNSSAAPAPFPAPNRVVHRLPAAAPP